MSKDKLVTSAQGGCLVKMANDKGIGRHTFQQAFDDGRVAQFLDQIKSGTFGLVPPHGARIHIVRARVKLDSPWDEAVNSAGPNTPSDYNVRKVGHLYQPTGVGEDEREFVLINFPSGDGSWDKATKWAKSAGLKNTVPREVFAIGAQHQELHRILGLNPMYVVATTECTFGGERQACGVWWGVSGRGAGLDWVGGFGNSLGWFAFGK